MAGQEFWTRSGIFLLERERERAYIDSIHNIARAERAAGCGAAAGAGKEVPMQATVEVKVRPRDAVPVGAERVAWLEAHGVLPDHATVRATAPLALWSQVVAVGDDGSVHLEAFGGDREVRDALTQVVLDRVCASGRVPESLPDADVERVLEEVRAARAARAAEDRDREEAARAVDEENRLVRERAWLSRPLDWYVSRDFDLEPRESRGADPAVAGLGPSSGWSPAVRLRREEVLAHVAVLHGQWESDREACAAALREIAARVPALARAASENYPVETQVLDHLARHLVDKVHADRPGVPYLYYEVDRAVWADPPDRAAPSEAAFALLDDVDRAIRSAQLPAAVGPWAVSRVVRVDSCRRRDHEHWVTAVLATLRTPSGTREVTFSLESLDCPHHDED